MKGKNLHRAIIGDNSSNPYSITKSRPGLKTQHVLDAIASYKHMKRDPRCQQTTPLVAAVHTECLELVKYLVEEGADVNEGQVNGVGPLSWALLKRNFEIATFFIKSGADVNVLDIKGRTPMFFAIHDDRNCPVSFIEQLITAGAPQDGPIQQDKSRPITRAVLANDIAIVKYLLQLSVDVNYPVTRDDTTPLLLAITQRSLEITELLVEHGANVEGQTIECPAPLISAVLSMPKGDIRCLRLLIGAGVDVHRVFHITSEEIVRGLKLGGPPGNLHLTALQFAIILGKIDAAEELLRAGVNVNATTPNTKRTALHLVCLIDYRRTEGVFKKLHQNMVRMLIENGADIRMKDNCGFSPAKCCYNTKNFTAMEELIKSGIDVNENLGGVGPILTYSVLLSNMDMVRLCLEYGGDSSSEFNSVKAYHMAYKKNDMQLIRLFFKYHPMDDIPLWTMHSLSGFYPPMFANQFKFFDGLKENNEVAVKSALRDGAEPRAFLKDLRYPIFLPVINKSLSILKILLNRGVHPNVNNEQGETPLHLSAGLGFLPGCYKLLQHGAGYNCKSSVGQSPLDVAKSSPTKNPKVVKLLENINRLFILARKGDKNATLQDFKVPSDQEFSSIVNCVNRKGKTLLKEAIDSGFPDVAELIMTHRLRRPTD